MSKIVLVLPSFAGGGAERVMLRLLNELDANTFETSIVVLEESGPLRSDVASHISVVSLRQPRVRSAMVSLWRELRKLSPAIVVTTMGYLNLAVLLVSQFGLSKTGVVVREANDPDATLKAFRWPLLVRMLYRTLYPRARAIICPSHAIREKLVREFAISTDLMRILRNPVDVLALQRWRMAPNPDKKETVFVASGRLTEQKGFDRLLEMFVDVREPSRLWILGDGPLRSELRGQALALKIDGRVEFLGFQDDPWRYYATADAFVMPSRWEGMPNAALEALACGTPVIATPEAGGIGEVGSMAPEGAVTLAESGEPFAAAMNAVIQRPNVPPQVSLLPDDFQLSAVCEEFTRLISSDVTS
ncbi:MAG: glycosyltransferase [Pseudomonadota bacterium]|nr:glycosyltransferase [Pseudomonadota bacterium]